MTQLSGEHAFRRFLRQLSTDSHEISKSSPNIGRNFVKLYAEFQKLNHLTCNK